MMYPGAMPDYMGWLMFGSYLFWGILIVLAVFLVVRLTRPSEFRSNAHAILEERLARGDINEDEFRMRLGLLRS